MTWSILARDGQGNFGVAIASRFFAVGALCVHAQRGLGALSTQALMNPTYGPRGMALLGSGLPAQSVIAAMVEADDGRDQRQLHVMPATGPASAFTGSSCVDWCGHQIFEDFSVAGNMLAGPQVLEATANAYRHSHGLPMAERLLAAMAAGEDAGGDKRGKQSSALCIQGDEDYRQLDLRVDDHEEPMLELRRLYDKSLERFQPFLSCLAGRHDAVGLTNRTDIEERIARFQAKRLAPPP